jgi:hypothetical protein
VGCGNYSTEAVKFLFFGYTTTLIVKQKLEYGIRGDNWHMAVKHLPVKGFVRWPDIV